MTNKILLGHSLKRSLILGAISGFIATWSISVILSLTEYLYGYPIGMFYSILGMRLGIEELNLASNIGFILHIITGTIIGTCISLVLNSKNVSNLKIIMSVGVASGILAWVVIFMPLTQYLINPSVNDIVASIALKTNQAINSDQVNQMINNIATGSFVFHLVWGGLYGFVFSLISKFKEVQGTKYPAYLLNESLTAEGRDIEGYEKERTRILLFGLIGGLVASLAVSGLLLISEKTISLPVGSFYMLVVEAILPGEGLFLSSVLGFILHIVAGMIIGTMVAIPYALNFHSHLIVNRYSTLYGLAVGFALWALLFVPVSTMIVIPLLTNGSDWSIKQQVPTGAVSTLDHSSLSKIANSILFGSLPFHMFFGLTASITIKSLNEKYLSTTTSPYQISEKKH